MDDFSGWEELWIFCMFAQQLQRNIVVALPPLGRLAMRSFEVSKHVPWVPCFVAFCVCNY